MAGKHPKAVLALLVLAAAALLGGTLAATASAHPAPSHSHPLAAQHGRGGAHGHPAGRKPVRAGSRYLALGDSVSFGYREPANLPTPDYSRPDTFVGYPENVAADLGVRLTNAACPGETSGSFIDTSAPSNGCEAGNGVPGYRDLYPLHTSYSGSQLHFAVQYLRHNRQTRLVSLMIGANDTLRCQATTSDQCASELPGVLRTLGANVRTILDGIRHDAHYRGQLVIVDYYSLDSSSAAQNAQSQALNQAIDTATRPYGVEFADGYGAFQRAAVQAGGHTCAAGLLTTLTTGGCGVHPSVAGQALLTLAVERAVSERRPGR